MKRLLRILLLLSFYTSIAQDLPPPAPAPSYNSVDVKVNFDTSFNNINLKQDVEKFMSLKGLGFTVNDKTKSNLDLSFDGTNYLITQVPDNRVIFKIDNSKPDKVLSILEDKMNQYAYGYRIKNLKLKNEDYKFSFRLLPVRYDEETLKITPRTDAIETDGIFNFNTSDSAAILEVTNHSDSPIYFSVVEINTKGELTGFIPNVNCALLGNERQIPPKKTVTFESCFFQFAPPYETLTLKGFASPEPINFNPIIKNEDSSSLEYIEDSYTEMYTYEFDYNIVDDNGKMPYNTAVDIYKPKTTPQLESAISELEDIKSVNGELSNAHIDKLKEITALHKALGNEEAAKQYAYKTLETLKKMAKRDRILAEQNAKKKAQIASTQKKSTNRKRREAEKRARYYAKLSDAEKVAFLEGENKTMRAKISKLEKEINTLKKQVQNLTNNLGRNGATRGAQPIPEKKDVVSQYTYRALVIAEQNYEDDNISDLKFPIKDAEEFKDVLVNNYAFSASNVTFLKDPTRKEIFDALHQLYEISSSKDHLLIFYAGHGVYDSDFKRGYWLPSDAELDSKSSWMSNLDIKDYITNIKTKHTLLISDACFSGSIFEFNRDVTSETSTKAVEKLLNKNARNAMTSGLDKPVPDESVFIKYLLKTLKENNAIHLKASDLFSTIQEVVLANTDNIPQYGVIRNANHEGGEFIFLKRKE
ncbi:MAG: hypothetical protein ED556_04665 [Winogradskyella sp.]|uniref:caspase family protein n=1 Tax=Winogradskyella sp. TaxID=1883156 RepID=UPI000F3D3CAE|nr:caspase family protein [Winogradskyella sp.]RNC86716.1 MAG: hypothetical protein ED556_04665 [Winogradskyella sp.]